MSLYQFYYIVSIVLYIYSKHVTASEYYVSAPNGEPCPPTTDLPCHNLSFYSDDYFTDDTIFYFLEGTHTLQEPLVISDVSNLTLQGLGHIEQGFHETIMQSTSVIMCSDYNEGGIVFTNSSQIILKNLTITSCGFYYDDDIVNNFYSQNNIGILFLNISSLTLEWVSVQNGSGLGLSLINAFDVMIADSSFAQNQLPYYACSDCIGGNAHMLYIDHLNKTQCRVNISRSNFTMGLNLKRCSKIKSSNLLDFGLGGGLTIELRQPQVQVYIDSVVFYGNKGDTGANFKFRSHVSPYSLTINNTVSTYGEALISGTSVYGCTLGVGMTLLQIEHVTENGTEIIIENSNFSHNVGKSGVGVNVFWSGGPANIKFHNCVISNNTGYHGLGLLFLVLEPVAVSFLQPTFHISNVLIESNSVSYMSDSSHQSAVELLNIVNVTFEQIEVRNHNTTGLTGLNSLLTFDKHSKFVNNSGIFGGGIALVYSSYLVIKKEMTISFINNHASLSGGGIFVSQVEFDRTIPIPCFFRVTNTSDTTNATLYFVNNTADISGDVLYGANIEYCIGNHYFSKLFDYSQQTGPSVDLVSSDPIQVCFCESNTPNCSIKYINTTAMPGISIYIALATVGSMNGLTEGAIQLTSSSVPTVYHTLNANCTNVPYVLKVNDTSVHAAKVYATLAIKSPIEPLYNNFAKIIEVNIDSCPIGFPLDLKNGTCVCRSELTVSPISCDINTQVITRDSNLWIGYDNNSDCLIVYRNCPYDYCNQGRIQFTITSPNPQCALNRSGLLCGQCAKGLSLMLGSNQCGQCTNDYLALIIPFALAGIALIAFLIALNLTVAIGTINGLIFYANVVKLYEPVFFPNGPIPFLSLFISWINLDLGIETCFYNGMGSCSKTWLQFIFPIYVWFLLILIIIMAQYSEKVVQLVGTHVVPVLATMILVSYTKLIRIVFQAIYVNPIQCNDETNVVSVNNVWYIDATVQYLEGCHLPLFLFSLAVLILLIVPYTCFLLAIPLLEGPLSKYMCCQKFLTYMKPFFDAYGGPYKDKCRFWTGFLLLVRVVLALVISLNIEAAISLTVLITILVIILFTYFLLRGIYRHFPLVLLEVFFVLNLLLVAKLNAVIYTYILFSMVYVVLCGIILYHVWDRLLKYHLQQPITKVMKIFKIKKEPPVPGIPVNEENPLTVSGATPFAPSISLEVMMRRETLIISNENSTKAETTFNMPFM